MIEIQEMVSNEIEEFLTRIGYGHLACARNDRPYVIPVHYAYRKPEIYIYTTEGLKTEIIRANPHVCLQVEEVIDNEDWRSVVITGDAEQITDQSHREEAIRLIRSTNPTLTPAISIRWVNNWIRENIRVVYRLMPENVTGRSPVKVRISAAFAQPGNKSPLLIRQHKYF